VRQLKTLTVQPGGPELDRLRDCDPNLLRARLACLLSPSPPDSPSLAVVPSSLQSLCLVLDRWSRTASVTPAAVRAVILCWFVLTRLDPVTGAERNTRKVAEQAREGGVEHQAAARLTQLFHLEEGMKTSSKKFCRATVHLLSQLQAILWAARAVNDLFGGVLTFPKLSELLNCTFIYNCIVQHEKFSIGSDVFPGELSKEFNAIVDKVLACLGNLSNSPVKPKKTKEKVIPKKRKNVRERLNQKSSLVSTTDQFLDENNIFSLLSLEVES